jgi:histidinol phosphatase-like enzyme (inositol monophosphatase family)
MHTPLETLAFAHRLADAARAAILPFFRSNLAIENKAETGFDPVTEADKAAETAMRSLIESERPHSGWTWVLDPIDGTRAFMAGTTTWGVLIGARLNGKPCVGIMDQPFADERWAASPERAFWSRGRSRVPLMTRKDVALNQALFATTDPYLFQGEKHDKFIALRSATRLSRFGLDCSAYALLAQGHIDLVVEPDLKDVDIAALIPLIEVAGGVVTDWHGRHNPKGGDVIAAGCPALHAKALALLTSPGAI